MCCNCGPTLLISLAIHATGPASAIQRATFRTGDHHFVRSSFSSIRAELAKPGRDYGRTERACGSRYHLALDSTLRAGTQSALPAGTGQDEWLLACRETYLRIAGKWTIYLPNGNPQPGPKFDYKLAWVRTFNRAGADEGRGAGRLGRRLQRRTDCAGHLSNAISR